AARRRLPLTRTRLPLAPLQLAAHLAALPLLAALPRVAAAGVIVPDRGGPPLSLRREVATVEVDNQLARTTLDQVFENRTDHPTGGTYAFPVPDGAGVSGFASWIDGRRVES